jgi:hypothetical protein
MADRYRLVVPRKDRDGKTWWTKVGVMWPLKGKDGFSITMEALPLMTMNDSNELECRIMVLDDTQDYQPSDHVKVKAKAKGNGNGNGNGYQDQAKDQISDLGDDAF